MGPRVRIRFPPGASQKIYHPLGCPSSDAASEYLITLRRNPIVTTQPATILSEVGAT